MASVVTLLLARNVDSSLFTVQAAKAVRRADEDDEVALRRWRREEDSRHGGEKHGAEGDGSVVSVSCE